MGIFSKPRKEEVVVQAVEVVTAKPQVFLINQRESNASRQGMWVKTKEGIGILTAPNEVTLVKEDGSTLMTIEGDVAVPKKVVVEYIEQACIEDIPASRRPAVEVLFALGYPHRS